MATKLAGVYGAAFWVSDDDELLVSWRTEAGRVYQNNSIRFEDGLKLDSIVIRTNTEGVCKEC